MFDGLTNRLGQVFDRLKRRGALSEADVTAALREVRVALLEADVALPVVKAFIDGVREKAVGQEVLRSVTPGQMASIFQVPKPATRRSPNTPSMAGSSVKNIPRRNRPRRWIKV